MRCHINEFFSHLVMKLWLFMAFGVATGLSIGLPSSPTKGDVTYSFLLNKCVQYQHL